MPRQYNNDSLSHNFVDLQLESKGSNRNCSPDRQRRCAPRPSKGPAPRPSRLGGGDGFGFAFESKHGEGVSSASGGASPDEMMWIGRGGTVEDNYFDRVVGVLEETIMDPMFADLQQDFCSAHCQVFENTEENKLEYTGLFNEYTELIEGHIEMHLHERIEDFDMSEFLMMCEERKDEVVGDVFDILLSCSDFEEFKSLMLSHRGNAFGCPQLMVMGC